MSETVTITLQGQAVEDLKALRPLVAEQWAKAPSPPLDPTDAQIVAFALALLLVQMPEEIARGEAGRLAAARPEGSA